MTEQYQPPLPDPEGIRDPLSVTSYGDPVEYSGSGVAGSYGTTAPGQTGLEQPNGDSQSTADVAKEQAANVTGTAKDAGQQVASTAKEQAGDVVAEAGRQTADLLKQAKSELSEQATTQQQRLAGGLKSLSGELHSMAENNDQQGVATQLARQGADLSDQVSSWLDEREPGRLLEDVRSFARQRPGAFLLLAAGAGVLAGRLTRGVKDASGSDSSSTPSSDGAPQLSVPPVRSSVEPPTVAEYESVEVYPAVTETPYGDAGSALGGGRS